MSDYDFLLFLHHEKYYQKYCDNNHTVGAMPLCQCRDAKRWSERREGASGAECIACKQLNKLHGQDDSPHL